jgi:transcription termination/antitermination protein NusG
LDAAVGLANLETSNGAGFGSFPGEELGDWHVLHTKSRQEKVVAQDLAAMGIGHYLPLVREVRFHGKRKAVVEAPLFPGYVFMRGEVDDAYRADRTKRIATIIPVRQQVELTVELGSLYLALTHNAKLMPWPYLKKGIRVEVRSGPFRGMTGVIEDRLVNDRLVLKVDMLGQAVCMEIDGSILDVLE